MVNLSHFQTVQAKSNHGVASSPLIRIHLLNVSAFDTQSVDTNINVTSVTNDISNDSYTFYPDVKQPLHMIVVLSIVFGFVFVCALMGNISVLCVIIKDRRFHSATYYLIANLSFADLLMATVCNPINLLVNIYNGKFFL